MCEHCCNRREFNTLTAAGLTGSLLGRTSVSAAGSVGVEAWDPDKPAVVTGRPLRVQPILTHGVMAPREKTSWRSWSEIINEPAAAEELQRIAGELKTPETRDSHWMMVYGDYLREVGYAAHKLGLTWDNISTNA
jgi:hypothetical protein